MADVYRWARGGCRGFITAYKMVRGLGLAGDSSSSRVLNERYRLDEAIGGGTTATIWRAWDRRLDRTVAVKVLDGTWLGRTDHNLNDLGNLVAHGEQREAHDKLAAIQKKNDDLLAAGKLSPAGHAALEDRLDQLVVAISAMPTV